MIARVRGVLVSLTPDGVVVDVEGVGYQVAMTPRGLAELPAIGEEVVLHTHLHLREDGMALFGFLSDSERDLFRVLLGASGVGPKLALSILATLPPVELRRAVASEDAGALSLVPGVGKRTAQKLILELRPRLALPDGELPSGAGSLADVRQALESLGYGSAQIRDVLASLPSDGPVEQLLREALQELGRQ
jgi:Holliday junction DNA helicase RuvA